MLSNFYLEDSVVQQSIGNIFNTRVKAIQRLNKYVRVIQPPSDQRNLTRLRVFYFGLIDDSVKLAHIMEGLVLGRLGVSRSFDGIEPPTMEAWRRGRTAAYGQKELKATEKGVEEETINSVVVRYYN